MDPHERRSAVIRRVAAGVGGVLVVAAVVLGVVGVVVSTGGSDLGLLALVAALALVTAGAGLIAAAVRSSPGVRGGCVSGSRSSPCRPAPGRPRVGP